jgi:hypothetical protein
MFSNTSLLSGPRPIRTCKMALVIQDDVHWNHQLLKNLNDHGICSLVANDWYAAQDLLKTVFIRLILIHRPLSEKDILSFISWLSGSPPENHIFFLVPQEKELDLVNSECRKRIHTYYDEPLKIQSLSRMIYPDDEPKYLI